MLKKNSYLVIAIILLIAAVLIAATIKGCEKTPEGNDSDTAGQESDEVDASTGYDAPDDEEILNRTGAGQGDGLEGDLSDDEGYTPPGCTSDADCATTENCYQGRCKAPECGSDADCVDDDPCSVDVCMYPTHPNAFCSTEIISRARNGDGCCPVGADIDKDTDCVPVCGNHKCEYGETVDLCADDCRHAGSGPDAAPSSPQGPTGPTSPT